MKIISDLHIHSKYSRATSKTLDIDNLEKYAKIKGLNLLGTGDFTHPKWIEEIKNNLTEEQGNGILRTKNGFPFVLQTEISLIYSQDGKGRRVHHIILAPNLDIVKQITEYLLKKGRVDYDGRPIFNISSDEFVYELKKISDKIEIIPAHCLTPDSEIHTLNQLKKIKDLQKKDLVLTHKGRYKKVKKKYQRKFSGDVIKIIPSCLKLGSYFTPEHPIYSIKTYKLCKNVPHTICKPTCAYLKRGCKIKTFQNYKSEWNQIRDLEKGDIILYPRYNKVNDKSFIYLNDIVPLFKEKKYIKPKNTKIFIKNIPIKNKIKISKEFCRLIGYYLAEGYCSKDNIGFTFSNKEKEYIKDVKDLLIKIFGNFIKIKIKKEKSKRTSIIIHSKILKEFFKIFYVKEPYKSFNKFLPYWFIDLPKDKLKELLIGWWRGDLGYTTSLNLCNQFKLIFIKLGIIPAISVISAENVNKRREIKFNIINKRNIIAKYDLYYFNNLSFFKDCCGINKLPEFKRFITKLNRRRGWIDENYIYLPIVKINKKKYSGLVYNLEVEKDNSYLTENLAVHNCWTPWFGMYGSKSGFNSLKECFKDQSNKIYAIETGLSSDPPMNWRIKELENKAILSFSDLHSYWPWRIGREATIFNLKKLTYNSLINSIRNNEISSTIEFWPEEGKYHYDGHRNCNVVMSPKEAIKNKNLCPVCKKELTIGVAHRVEELADSNRKGLPYINLIPLSELIAGINKCPVSSQKMWNIYNNLIKNFDNEINILLNVSKEKLLNVVNEKTADIIIKNREQKIFFNPGYDGEYGKPIFSEEDKIEIKPKVLQKGLGDF